MSCSQQFHDSLEKKTTWFFSNCEKLHISSHSHIILLLYLWFFDRQMLVTIFPFICVKSMTFGMESISWKGMSCSEKHSYWRVLIGGYMTYFIVKAAHSLIVSLCFLLDFFQHSTHWWKLHLCNYFFLKFYLFVSIFLLVKASLLSWIVITLTITVVKT